MLHPQRLLFVLFGFTIIYVAHGQKKNDSLVIKKYQVDTVGFSHFPKKNIIEGIHPGKGFTAWELDAWTRWEGYRSIQRTPAITEQNVLSKPESGFGTFCPPEGCFWYFTAKRKQGVEVIADLTTLKKFIGPVDTPYDAYVWLVGNWEGASTFVPANTSGVTYKKVRKGYLISLRRRIGDCPVTSADLIYFVGKKYEIIRVGMSNITSSNACI